MARLIRRRNRLYVTLTRHYLIFFLTIPALLMISSGLAHWLVTNISGGIRNELKLTAAFIVRPDYQNIDIADVQQAGGWVEIIRDHRTVYVLGDKQDAKTEYTDSEIGADQAGALSKGFIASFTDSEYYYSTASFVGEDRNTYTCMVKIPLKNIETGIAGAFDPKNPAMRFERILLMNLVATFVIFCVLFVFSIVFFGRITARKIASPLEDIHRGLKAITAGHLATRMDFEAEKEFADIRDAFNYMAGRLQDAERDKREIEKNRKNLIMGISHDLKTPITTVYGYARALTEGMVDDPERQRRHLIYIRDKALTMARLIDDLFKYSSIEASEYTLNRKREDFAEFLRELVAENYLEIEDKGFRLDLDIPEEAVEASFDRAELMRALGNILGNALKYNPAGTILSVKLTRNGDLLQLVIGDDGIGIAAGLKGAIFDEFVRGDAARSSDGGSGLGLAIARRIIQMHGGSIGLIDTQGKGTAFSITLPVS